jgi:hypothetical protein
MTEPSRNPAAVAGLMLVTVILLCAGAGIGIGALVDMPTALGIAGGFVGVALGFALVYARFKTI